MKLVRELDKLADRELDVEGDNNRGWQVDKVSAILDGEQIGYLKISYIPQERFVRYYPSIFHFLDQISGHCYHCLTKPAIRPLSALTDEEKETVISTYQGYHRLGLDDATSTDLRFRAVLNDANDRHRGTFRTFERHWLDRPVVDFVRVDPEHQRRGIGLSLYREAGQWMLERNLRLRASTLQSPAATAAWEKMEGLGWVTKIGQDRYLTPPPLSAAA